MMIRKYVLVDEYDNETLHEFDDPFEAISTAAALGTHAVVERLYEYTDSSLIWAPGDAAVWPLARPDERVVRTPYNWEQEGDA